jgi:hypothetical protein
VASAVTMSASCYLLTVTSTYLRAVRLLPAHSAYQRALKYGDMGAQKLMECLLARPAASSALTKALKKVRGFEV